MHRMGVIVGVLLILWCVPARAQIIPGVEKEHLSSELQRYRAEALRGAYAALGEWQQAWGRDDVGAILRLYSGKAVVGLPTEVKLVQGKTELEQTLQTYLPRSGALALSLDDAEVGGSLVYIQGKFFSEDLREPSEPGGPAENLVGTYTTVMVREGKGWKIRAQIFRVAPVREGLS